MSCQNCVLPSGFKIAFVPTDEQIIRDYLFNKVYGNPLPSDEAIVDHCDLYDESDDWKKHFEERGGNILYFFTPLKKKSENGSKIDRTTKCGATWKSQTEKRILDGQSQQHIGSKKNLTFLPKNDDQVKGGMSWVMYQFRLDGIVDAEICSLDDRPDIRPPTVKLSATVLLLDLRSPKTDQRRRWFCRRKPSDA